MKALVLILIPAAVFSSTWYPPGPCEAIANNRITFIGTVQSSRPGSAVVQVEQGGPLPQGTILDMMSPQPIDNGKWFIVASKGVGNLPLVFPETGDRYLLEDAQPVRWEHRAFFKALRDNSAGATLTIHLMAQTDRQVILEIDSGEHRYSAIVESGRAEFRHVEPGEYRISLAPDPLYEIDESPLVTIRDGACARDSVVLRHKTSLRGTLRTSSGEPVAGGVVQLIAGDRIPAAVQSNQDGEFILSGMKPGDYTLRFVPSTHAPFPVTERPVLIKSGEPSEDVLLVLPPKLKTVERQVVVTWPDGSPVSDGAVHTWCPVRKEHIEVPLDANGRAGIELYSGQNYTLSALGARHRPFTLFATDPLLVTATSSTQPVKLVLTDQRQVRW